MTITLQNQTELTPNSRTIILEITDTEMTVTSRNEGNPNNLASSSMFKVFSADRTVTGLGSPTSTTSFASSTPGAGNALWLYTSNASTTGTHFDVICQ